MQIAKKKKKRQYKNMRYIKGFKENLNTAWTKEWASKVRMNNRQKPNSRYNLKNIDISDETLM